LPCHVVLHLDGIADSEDVGVAHAHMLVDTDAAALADVEPGRLDERSVRAHAKRQDHDIGRVGLAGPGLHLQRTALELPEAGDAVAERQLYAMLL